MVDDNKITLNFYTITSNFNDILLKICNKIIHSDDNFYVNFDKPNTKNEVDKFLWTREKNNFLPHKVYGEEIFSKDKIILFDGCYKKLNRLSRFKCLMISPCVKIKKFDIFKKFLIFSYSKNNSFNTKIRNQLNRDDFIINWYDEYNPFKWKQL